ncbi:MAG: hypothetical protein RIQ79_2291 [Verrucomicrobiota bacterium]
MPPPAPSYPDLTTAPFAAPGAAPAPGVLLRQWLWRTLRVLPLAATLLGLVTLLALGGVALVNPYVGAVPDSNLLRTTFVVGYLSLLVVLGWVLVTAWRKQWRARGALIGLLILAPIFAYLARDEALRSQPMDFAALGEIVPGDAESHALALRFTRKAPGAVPYRGAPALAAIKGGPGNADWAELAAQDPAAIQAAASELQPVTEWWAELAACSRIGDVSTRSSAPVPDFAPMRDLAKLRCAQAARLALDGRGDEGLSLLQPLVEVANKLEAQARSHRRIVAAQAVADLAIAMADQIMSKARTSPEARERFAAALRAGLSGERGVRRLLAVEHVFANEFFQTLASQPQRGQSRVAAALERGLSLFHYNPNRTVNALDAVMIELQEHGARRDREGMKRCMARFRAANSRGGIKNQTGREFLAQVLTPSTAVWRYWEQQDRKTALLVRLDAMDASSGAHS